MNNDLMNCYRRFNADFMKLYISALGHARKLKLSSCVLLLCINQILQKSDSVQCFRGLHFSAWALYLSMEHYWDVNI